MIYADAWVKHFRKKSSKCKGPEIGPREVLFWLLVLFESNRKQGYEDMDGEEVLEI